MRLDHLLSRDLGVCGGRGARTGVSPGPLVACRGAGRAGAREHAPLSPLFCWVRGGCLPSFCCFLRVCVGCGGGVGACCRGLGLRALLCPASASLLVVCCCLFGGGVGGCGGVGGLVVNCIVDASIFVLCGVFLLCASRLGPAALFVVWWVLGVVSACVVCCFYGRSVDALAPGADEGRGGLR